MTIPFHTIKSAALASASQLLSDWFPQGRLIGHEYRVGSLLGEPGQSLAINIRSGRWGDFNGGPAGGDLIDLRAAQCYAGDVTAAALEIGRTLGIYLNGHARETSERLTPNVRLEERWCPQVPPPENVAPPDEGVFSGFDVLHEYTNAQDRVTHYVGRIEARDGRRKLFVPVTYGELDGVPGWHRKAAPKPRPLYGLNRLGALPGATVLLCEGEKAADCAQRLFPNYACLSWCGGTGSVDYADLAPIVGLEVIIWPDADSDRTGRKAAEKLAPRLPGSRILQVGDLADEVDGFDAADLDVDDPQAWLEARLPPQGSSTEPPPVDGEDDYGSGPDQTRDEDDNKPPLFRIVSPVDLVNVPLPQREWLVDEWLPVGYVTLNYGDGGVGKTLLAQQLMTATALARGQVPWCGMEVEHCRSFGLFCEDSEQELHLRQHAICSAYGLRMSDLGAMQWVSGVGSDNALMSFDADGRPRLTNMFEAVERAVVAHGARLVVLDTAADLFDGNENDRRQVRRFIGALGGLAQRVNGAVLLNAHPSRDGLKTGNLDGASTAWNNTARSRWSLGRLSVVGDADPDVDARVLTKRKANYARIGDEIKLRWIDGALMPELGTAARTGAATRAHAEELFLTLLDRCMGQDQSVSSSNHAGNYAPKIFTRRPDSDGHSKRDFEIAMSSLFATRRIRNAEYGRAGKKAERIIREPGQA